MCGIKNVGGCVSDAAGKVAGSAGESAMDGIANWFNEAAEWSIKNLTAAWLKAPAPDVDSSTSVAGWLGDRLWFLVLASMVGSIFFAAYKMALTPRAEHLRSLGESFAMVILTATIAGSLVATSVEAGDVFSQWILDQADLDLTDSFLLPAAQMNPGFVLMVALVMLVIQVIQLVLMVVRNAMVIYLVAMLPLAAATSTTAAGKQRFSKAIAWLIAFVLYKPVAALIYAGAFKLLGSKDDILAQATGLAAVILAVMALPAMMRFLVPATAQMTSGNAGAMAAGLVGAGLATGAMVASGGASGGLSGSSAGASAMGGTSATGGGFGGGFGAGPDGAAPGGGSGGTGKSPAPGGGPTPASGSGTPDSGGKDDASGLVSGGDTDGPSGTPHSPDTQTPRPPAETGGGSYGAPSGSGSPVSGGDTAGGESSWHNIGGAARFGADLSRRSADGASGVVEDDQ
ncbi:hypothetical protein [Solicola sp. PLA-1-18]|uniref:hypothetical protein n=1 Tax=Solicola sp. PLA-1-18 TaxID=3380532 RepID=UPI003B7D670C